MRRLLWFIALLWAAPAFAQVPYIRNQGGIFGSSLPLTGGTLAGALTLSSGDITIPAASAYLWSARSKLTSSSDGTMLCQNNAGSQYCGLSINSIAMMNGATQIGAFGNGSAPVFTVNSSGKWQWSNSGSLSAFDLAIVRAAAGVMGLTDSSTGGAELEFKELTDCSTASTDKARLCAKDNGSGKTQLCVRFQSGATQVIATEP